jgi:hypothetical protein
MRIFIQLLMFATAVVLGVALAAATNPKPVLREIVLELTGGPMGTCMQSATCRKVMNIPVRHQPLPDRTHYQRAPADMDRA